MNINKNVENSVRGSIWRSVDESVRVSVRCLAYESIQRSVERPVLNYGWGVRTPVGITIWASVRGSIADNIKEYE